MKLILLTFLCFFILSVNAQESYIEKHHQYFKLPRESIFVHTNKSIFMAGEYLWYKGYAIDRSTGKLSKDVRNIQVFVYDSIGGLIEESMVLANEGIFFNQIKIDSTYTPGRYYFKAMTNYMNNFKEPDAYLQKFEVIDEIKKTTKKAKDLKITVQPEGQEIIYGLNTNLGIKITNDLGYPEQSNLKLLEDNIPKWEVESSKSGLAKINFRPIKGKAYKIKVITQGGFEKEIPIQDIKFEGTSLQLNDLKKCINLNIESTDLNKNEIWQLVIFQEKNISTVNIKMNSSKKSIILEKDKLFDGVNTIQLLKNGNPILERLFYNEAKDETRFQGDYRMKEIAKEDSIVLNLNFKNKSKLILSASVLPKENITYQSQKSIIKTLRLRPYIESDDYDFFFKSADLPSLNELDVVLLMSKSRYRKSLNSSKPPEKKYKRENGFEQTLYLIDKIEKEDLLLVGMKSKFNKDIDFKLDNSRAFFLKNRYPVIGEKLDYYITTEDGNFKAPKLTLETKVNFNDQHPISFQKLDSSPFRKDITLSTFKLTSNFSNINQLDEVTVKAVKGEEKKGVFYLERGEKEIITPKIERDYMTLSSYLTSKGFRVTETSRTFVVQRYNTLNKKASIFLDGVRMNPFNTSLASILSFTRLNQYESVTINRNAYGAGPDNDGGLIIIKSRRNNLNLKDDTEMYTSIEVVKGYKKIKKYINPYYGFYESEMFKSLGSIAWFPNIVVKDEAQENNSVELKIIDTGLEQAMIYIEGISEDGQLHSYNFPIELKKD
ncbi:hypothetical protein [Psychroflexus tropicus]|uniref:hypothetical protein n=1 Tax=Psychroflexus tropicus TaxID=197345 RepID=UPI0005251534|nr:hypothetical protein [Psychroflexus tropicus]